MVKNVLINTRHNSESKQFCFKFVSQGPSRCNANIISTLSSSFFFRQDFGSIFSTLLPGTNAKLAPPEGLSVLDGLEVKVAFGNVWKESLTELSGGQR